MPENLAIKTANMYAEGSSFGEISKNLEVSKSRVGDLLRDGIESLRNNQGEVLVQEDGEQENTPKEEDFLPGSMEDSSELDAAWGKTILIQATPILRKIVLNSKVYLQHEYFVKHLGYEGDIGDLLVEALEFYWKEMGFTIHITQDSVLI